MKSLFNLSVLAVLLIVSAVPCHAMISVTSVSREQAKEMGMEIRLRANGADQVWVFLEIKPTGKLKDFSHVSLEIRDAGKLLLGWMDFGSKRKSSGNVVASFLVDRAFLEKIGLRVMVQSGLRTGAGYDLRVADFVEQKNAP
jgi:hypothetical protein